MNYDDMANHATAAHNSPVGFLKPQGTLTCERGVEAHRQQPTSCHALEQAGEAVGRLEYVEVLYYQPL
jgi:hypothetical protein